MPRGYPDYFGLPIFPKLGPYNREYKNLNLTSADLVTPIDISGKGRIYGGYGFAHSDFSLIADAYYTYVDGELSAGTAFTFLHTYGHFNNPALPLSLLHYDTVLNYMSVLFGGGITFEQSFQVKYDPLTNDARNVKTTIFWSKII